jgi:hypothetical protein
LIVRRLIRTRIDLCEQIALVHGLAFSERDLLQLAIDARGHRHRVEGLHGTESLKIDRHIGVADRGSVDANRLRRRPACRIGRLVHNAEDQHQRDQRGADQRRALLIFRKLIHLGATLLPSAAERGE